MPANPAQKRSFFRRLTLNFLRGEASHSTTLSTKTKATADQPDYLATALASAGNLQRRPRLRAQVSDKSAKKLGTIRAPDGHRDHPRDDAGQSTDNTQPQPELKEHENQR